MFATAATAGAGMKAPGAGAQLSSRNPSCRRVRGGREARLRSEGAAAAFAAAISAAGAVAEGEAEAEEPDCDPDSSTRNLLDEVARTLSVLRVQPNTDEAAPIYWEVPELGGTSRLPSHFSTPASERDERDERLLEDAAAAAPGWDRRVGGDDEAAEYAAGNPAYERFAKSRLFAWSGGRLSMTKEDVEQMTAGTLGCKLGGKGADLISLAVAPSSSEVTTKASADSTCSTTSDSGSHRAPRSPSESQQDDEMRAAVQQRLQSVEQRLARVEQNVLPSVLGSMERRLAANMHDMERWFAARETESKSGFSELAEKLEAHVDASVKAAVQQLEQTSAKLSDRLQRSIDAFRDERSDVAPSPRLWDAPAGAVASPATGPLARGWLSSVSSVLGAPSDLASSDAGSERGGERAGRNGERAERWEAMLEAPERRAPARNHRVAVAGRNMWMKDVVAKSMASMAQPRQQKDQLSCGEHHPFNIPQLQTKS